MKISKIILSGSGFQHSWWNMACALVMLCAAMAIASSSQTFSTLVDFDGTNGAYPLNGPLVQGFDGNLYGTTNGGGANFKGTVFKITPVGTLTTLYSFCARTDCADGAYPIAGLVQATDGSLYGTTYSGGARGVGMVFKITSGGKLTRLHSFDGADGANPWAVLFQASDGNFYGTTLYGGSDNFGTAFKITTAGALTLLHSFDGADGAYPNGLVQGTDGNFYGTTGSAGANGVGTVFKITPRGTLTSLYNFCAQGDPCTDGAFPYAGLVHADDGNFYGTTFAGGAHDAGTVFKITSEGALTTLYNFCPQGDPCTDGAYPYDALAQAIDGNFYGTTYGGADIPGTIFQVTPAGTLTTLHTFDSADDELRAGLLQATNGTFYGTTNRGGTNNDGTVFSLDMELGPFVETLPTFGKVGRPVRILGTNLTGTTNVTFNGTEAAFSVVSSSLIKTTVPGGATSGKVQVTTPGGTLTSNVVFQVRP